MSLIDLICDNKVTEVKKLIETGCFNYYEYEEDLLVMATKYASVEMLKLIWRCTPLQNPYKDEDGWNLLHYAIIEGKADTTAFLVRKGVDANHLDVHGLKPMDYVKEELKEEFEKILNK